MKRQILFLLLTFACKESTQKVVEWYPNGQVMTESFYKDKKDTSNYVCKVYYANGNLKYQTQIASNMFIGEKKFFLKMVNFKGLRS